MGTFVGIDLGTTFSVVACIRPDGKPQTIPNQSGKTLTPSVVYLGEGGPIVGEEAKERQSHGAVEVASFFKRNMGDPHFELSFCGRSYTATDLSALVLKQLKQTAEDFLKQAVTHAVITVPAYFNNMQREATIEAGRRAGLQVLSIISEPTSAALAYGMRPVQGSQTIMVYDLGGGTFDVSVVQITPTEQRVLGTDGDHNLGGKDWDDRIVSYLAQKFEDEFGVELVGDDFNELLVKAENAKKALSARTTVEVKVQAGGHAATYTISRDQFENMTTDLMRRTQEKTEQVLKDISQTWSQLNNVLLVGGSTRMPMVKNYVERMSGKPPLQTINPDEAVALGAAIQAAVEMEALQGGAPMFTLAGRKKSVDVMSHSLGMIAINDDGTKYINSIIIRKNQAIPSLQTRPYTLAVSRRGDSKCEVYMTQGETADPMSCAYLGKYVFTKIPPVSTKTAILDITYAYDKNGVVNVSGVERSTGQALALAIEPLPPDVPDRFAKPPAQQAAREHLTVYLAFDLSGSMSGEPLAEAQKAAHAFVSQCDLANTSVGLISFSDSVHIETRPCQNAAQIDRAINGLAIGRTGYGNATHPFNEIGSELSNVKGVRYAIVLADGVWENQSGAIERARKCHQAGIEIIGVGFGGADQKFLRAISSSDENSFFTDLHALTETFSTIAQELTEGTGRSGRGALRTL
jgi:molecular chaperone DnaK (HSP70)/uncharacterized protein YegL